MAIPITIPRLGWNMEEGTFLGWLKQDGQEVRPAKHYFASKVKRRPKTSNVLIAASCGSRPAGPGMARTVPVGSIIGHVLHAGEELPLSQSGTQVERPASAPTKVCRPRSSRIYLHQARCSRLYAPGSSPGCGTGHTLEGSRRQWPRWAHTRTRRTLRCGKFKSPARDRRTQSWSPRATVANLVKSAQATVPVTLTTTCDASNLIAWRGQYQALSAPDTIVPSLTDLFVKLAATALEHHPLLAGAGWWIIWSCPPRSTSASPWTPTPACWCPSSNGFPP